MAANLIYLPNSHKAFLGPRQQSSIVLSSTDNYEVLEALNNLCSYKSSGYIDIPIELYKHSKFVICNYLVRSFNCMLEEGEYPDIFKIAKVVPIHKGGSKQTINNYRPISVLSPLNKVFELLLKKRLTNFWKKYNLFSDYQFGFREGHSTTLAITHLFENLLHFKDNDDIACSVFLDVAKAFDSVNHEILLDKLEHYGVRGISIKLLKSYLTNRKQYVYMNGSTSKLISIDTGVPQGSVLGPFLFLVYVNDLVNCSNFNTVLYADDTVLTMPSNTVSNLKFKVEAELQKVLNWYRSNKLSLNYKKTQMLLFDKRSNTNKNFTISINDQPVISGNSIKYLGVVIDKELSWKQHAEHITSKLSIALGIFHKLKYYVPQSTLIQVYYGLVYPYLHYAITTWSCTAKKYLHTIQVLQNKIVKIITNTNILKLKILPLYNQLSLLPLHKIHDLEVAKFMYRLKTRNLPLVFKDYYCSVTAVHRYRTRHASKNYFFHPRVNKARTQMSIKVRGAKLWNNLPVSLTEDKIKLGKQCFFKAAKKHFLSEL